MLPKLLALATGTYQPATCYMAKEDVGPSGYEDVSAARGAPWYRPKGEDGDAADASGTVHGELLGRFPKKSRVNQAFYQIRLLEPCIGFRKPEGGARGEREAVNLNKGDIINVDERSQLESLKGLCDDMKDGIRYNVWFRFEKEIDIGGGQTVLVFTGPKKKRIS